jgi:FHA domain-containing protein
MSAEWLALLLRIALVVCIYVFLFQVVLLIRRDLATIRSDRPPAGRAWGRGLARLTIVDPAKSSLLPGQSLTLTGVNSIGRGPANAIPLDDASVSARHAVLAYRDRGWWIEDLGSTNGTFLNGRPVDRRTPVSAGDQIEIGAVRLRFEDI